MNTSRRGLRSDRRSRVLNSRAGLATLWLVLMLPLVLLLLGFVIEIGNLWLARAELENALESAALAAVKEWGDAGGVGGTLVPRQVGQTFAAASTVRGNSVVIGLNRTAATAANPNENLDGTFPTAQQIFGAITSSSPTVVFKAGVAPACGSSVPTGLGTVLFDAFGINQMARSPVGFVPVSRLHLDQNSGLSKRHLSQAVQNPQAVNFPAFPRFSD